MVLENIITAPTTRLSPRVKPKSSATTNPTKAKLAALTRVTTVASRSICSSFWGCRSRPSKNSKKIIPTWPIC